MVLLIIGFHKHTEKLETIVLRRPGRRIPIQELVNLCNRGIVLRLVAQNARICEIKIIMNTAALHEHVLVQGRLLQHPRDQTLSSNAGRRKETSSVAALSAAVFIAAASPTVSSPPPRPAAAAARPRAAAAPPHTAPNPPRAAL